MGVAVGCTKCQLAVLQNMMVLSHSIIAVLFRELHKVIALGHARLVTENDSCAAQASKPAEVF